MLRELPFYLALDGALLSGKIDAWLGEGALVDYKTGAFSEAAHERYALQLRIYAAAARALQETAPREGVLYYVDAGMERRVPFTPVELDETLAAVARAVAERTDPE